MFADLVKDEAVAAVPVAAVPVAAVAVAAVPVAETGCEEGEVTTETGTAERIQKSVERLSRGPWQVPGFPG